jgi:flagellar basal body-associated protein FliL
MSCDWETREKEHEEKKKSNPKKKKNSSWLRPVYIFMVIMGIVTSFFLLQSSIRWIRNEVSYESKVQQTIIEMVKPEALKEKYKDSIKKKI